MSGTTLAYLAAASFALFWAVLLFLNIKPVLQWIYARLKDFVCMIIGVTGLVIYCSVALLLVVMVLCSVWYTVAPLFVSQAPGFLSLSHLAGMLIDWTIVVFLLAVIQNIGELIDALQDLIKPESEPEDPYKLQGAHGVSADSEAWQARPPHDEVIHMAAGAARRGNPSIDKDGGNRQADNGIGRAQPPVEIQRTIPDHWLSPSVKTR